MASIFPFDQQGPALAAAEREPSIPDRIDHID